MFVLGTAGHVDHGKSALIQALTGMDPDRLREEKERGMTIDLGFAWLVLPSGREISIIDVPGHERFISNMLAGVGGIDIALMVVGADEGVMPQTREHLAILDLLGIKSGIIAITKKDLVDADWLELVEMDVADLLKDTSLAGAKIITVSAVTREGLDDLLKAIDRLIEGIAPKKDVGKPRLPVDRVFTISGFGTVVTGTLVDGQLNTGQEMEILPVGTRSRIRGLQTHKKKVETATPGSRVAVNLVGVSTEQVKRGLVVTTPGWLKPTGAVDVKLRILKTVSKPLKHNAHVAFFHGADEVAATVRLLDKNELAAGETGWAQVVVESPVAVVKGEPFVIRSPNETLGGGYVIDTHARRHRRFRDEVSLVLEGLDTESPGDIVTATIHSNEFIDVGTLINKTNLPLSQVEELIETLAAEKKLFVLAGRGSQAVLVTDDGYQKKGGTAVAAVGNFHVQYPLRRGMAREELRSRLKIASQPFDGFISRLVQDGLLVEKRNIISLPSFNVVLSPQQEKDAGVFLQSLADSPYAPPSGFVPEPELLNCLIDEGKVVKVSGGIFFSRAAYDEMVGGIIEKIKAEGKITLGEVRDMFSTSRKYAQGIIEHLDEQKITRRVGDERVLRDSSPRD